MTLIVLWLLAAAVGALIGSAKRRGPAGLLYSLALGPLGWLLIALAEGHGRRCPFCRKWYDEQTLVCPKCRMVPAAPEQQRTEEPSAVVFVDRHPRPNDKNRSIRWARDTISRADGWLIWDTETTGIGTTAEIIQIGLLAPDGSTVLDTYVRPLNRKRIPPDATAINGITMKMLADAPSFPDLVPTLSSILGGKRVIAYNAEFERRLLRQTATRNGGRVPPLSWECAMLQYARYVGQWMEYKREYKWQKLPKAHHGAIADCRATLDLLKAMAGGGDAA